jgi:hypothetical protein
VSKARAVGRHEQTFGQALSNFLRRERSENYSGKMNFDFCCLLLRGTLRDILVNCIKRTHCDEQL